MENTPGAKKKAECHELCFGTIDTWLVYCLTDNYKTDYSNASRTQLFNIHSLKWDVDICAAFGLCADDLAEITDSDAVFGYTGMAESTYGTGSSIMMNIGSNPIESQNGLVTSLAWKYRATVHYVMEGNLNYTGAVIR